MGIIENFFRPIPAFLGVLIVIWLGVVFKHIRERLAEMDARNTDLTRRVSELELELKALKGTKAE